MNRMHLLLILASLMLPANRAQAQAHRPVIAVFDVEVKRLDLSAGLLDGLGDHLATRLTETGHFQVVPRSMIKKRLSKQKSQSYKQCFEQSCQIELGRELAAEKTLSAQIVKFSKLCTVNLTLYDLKSAATESAASVRHGCDEEGLLTSFDKAVDKLVAGASTPSPPSHIPKVLDNVMAEPPPGMAFIPGGPFFMGCNVKLDKHCQTDEKPGHRVSLDAFFIDLTEVTVAAYTVCVKAGKCKKPAYNHGTCSYFEGSKKRPVDCVDWDMAATYCTWVGKRLPTEAEWEKAARGTDGRTNPWGEASPDCNRANQSGCGQGRQPPCTHPAGNSPYGLCDTMGNYSEWVADYYAPNYYVHSPATNPKGPKQGFPRVIRGSNISWNVPTGIRVSNRLSGKPDGRWTGQGFRCAKSIQR